MCIHHGKASMEHVKSQVQVLNKSRNEEKRTVDEGGNGDNANEDGGDGENTNEDGADGDDANGTKSPVMKKSRTNSKVRGVERFSGGKRRTKTTTSNAKVDDSFLNMREFFKNRTIYTNTSVKQVHSMFVNGLKIYNDKLRSSIKQLYRRGF